MQELESVRSADKARVMDLAQAAVAQRSPKGQKVTGVSLGPDVDGILRIRDRAGTIHTVFSGDINLAGKISG